MKKEVIDYVVVNMIIYIVSKKKVLYKEMGNYFGKASSN